MRLGFSELAAQDEIRSSVRSIGSSLHFPAPISPEQTPRFTVPTLGQLSPHFPTLTFSSLTISRPSPMLRAPAAHLLQGRPTSWRGGIDTCSYREAKMGVEKKSVREPDAAQERYGRCCAHTPLHAVRYSCVTARTSSHRAFYPIRMRKY